MSEKTAIEVLQQVEWISVFDGEGQPYAMCPFCFADRQALTRACRFLGQAIERQGQDPQ